MARVRQVYRTSLLAVEPINGIPLCPGVSCNGSDVKPAVGSKEQAGVSDQPPVVESIDNLPIVSGVQLRWQ